MCSHANVSLIAVDHQREFDSATERTRTNTNGSAPTHFHSGSTQSFCHCRVSSTACCPFLLFNLTTEPNNFFSGFARFDALTLSLLGAWRVWQRVTGLSKHPRPSMAIRFLFYTLDFWWGFFSGFIAWFIWVLWSCVTCMWCTYKHSMCVCVCLCLLPAFCRLKMRASVSHLKY